MKKLYPLLSVFICAFSFNVHAQQIFNDKETKGRSHFISYNYSKLNTIKVASGANFSSSDSIFCEKQCIDFFDHSKNSPTSWHWFFQGGVPDTSTMQNPNSICYNSYGWFDVMLIACTAINCDTIIRYGFIQEYQNPFDSIWQYNGQLYSTWATTYQWYEVNSGLIPGATNWNYQPTQPGSYYCVTTNSVGCAAVSNPITSTIISDYLNNENSPHVAPNPFTNHLNFTLNNNQLSEVVIYDVALRKIFSTEFTNHININTDQFPKGIFFYELKCNNMFIKSGRMVK